jgi:3-hydroxypropanoate dehydrogenase
VSSVNALEGRAPTSRQRRETAHLEERSIALFNLDLNPSEIPMHERLGGRPLDQLFRTARTHVDWIGRSVTDTDIRELYDLFKMGPTSANCCPARFVWVRSSEGKELLAGYASGSNSRKILAAPVTVIIGYDLDFSNSLPELFPAKATAMRALFEDAELAWLTAFRNSSLQGAYLMLGARALGLDCAPMSGFDNSAVDRAFFSATNVKSNFICSIGYGSAQNLHPRNPRLDFEEVNRFA